MRCLNSHLSPCLSVQVVARSWVAVQQRADALKISPPASSAAGQELDQLGRLHIALRVAVVDSNLHGFFGLLLEPVVSQLADSLGSALAALNGVCGQVRQPLKAY